MKAAVVVVKHRRSLLCRRLHHIDGLKVRNTLRYHFSQCIQHAEKAGWRSRSYKIRFLGILPHLLLVLDAAKNSTHLSKNELKELRSEASGDELNALNDRQTLLKRVYLSAHRPKRRLYLSFFFSSYLKRLENLNKQLQVDAEIHNRQDVSALMKTLCEATESLREMAPRNLSGEAKDSFEILTSSVAW